MTDIYIDNPELAQELTKRVVSGALKACRTFIPTKENDEGKKVHCDVSLYNNTIYVGTDHSLCCSTVELKLPDMCKKKSPLRAIVESTSISANLNYGLASPWLKTHEKNVRSAYIGPSGIRLIVAEGVVELNLAVSNSSIEYAERIIDTIYTRISDDNLLVGPFEIPEISDTTVLSVTNTGVNISKFFTPNSEYAQIRLKPKSIPSPKSTISVYVDPLADPSSIRIIKITSETDVLHIDQFFRILMI
jgi:hypothetical protein